ncbi:MAG: endolytic transglycosylase MltG [Candidatus Kerfeldbacteria bacterium]
MRHRRTSPVISAILFVVPVILIGVAVWWFFTELRPVNSGNKDTQTFTVPQGSGVRSIAQQLAEAKLIRNEYIFEATVVLAGLGKDLRAGTFELSPSMSATAIARALVKPSATDVTIQIPEGWTSSQIGEYLQGKGIGMKEEFVTAASTIDSRTILPDDRFDFLAGRPATATLEGYLFPDTYRVFPNASTADIIKKMLTNFGTKVMSSTRNEIVSKGKTLYDVVTLASIVELEVRSETDRKMVADIFWRRLAVGMPLQSDATVNFVTGKKALQPTESDISVGSPYNTYVNRGLPPGPISNPGLVSISATNNPQPNSYLYFLTDASGSVHYAMTYEEHLANKQQYLR